MLTRLSLLAAVGIALGSCNAIDNLFYANEYSVEVKMSGTSTVDYYSLGAIYHDFQGSIVVSTESLVSRAGIYIYDSDSRHYDDYIQSDETGRSPTVLSLAEEFTLYGRGHVRVTVRLENFVDHTSEIRVNNELIAAVAANYSGTDMHSDRGEYDIRVDFHADGSISAISAESPDSGNDGDTVIEVYMEPEIRR